MSAQARKEAEDAVKKRKVAAAGWHPGGSQTNSISQGGAESCALAQAAASRGSGWQRVIMDRVCRNVSGGGAGKWNG
jgi:hypothetical protein